MSKKTFRIGAVLTVLCFFFHLNTAHAYSISESDSVMQKIIYTSSLYCYEDGALNTFTTVGSFNGTMESLQGNKDVNEGGNTGHTTSVPYYGTEKKSCNDLLVHNTANKFSSSIINDDNSRAKILEGMAYSKISEAISSNTDKCISYPYRVSGSSDIKYTEKVCAKRENGKWLVYLDETQIASDKVNEISVVDNQYRTGVISFEYFKPNIWAGNASPDYHFKTVKITIPDDKPDEAAVFAHIGTELAKTIGVIGADGKGTIQTGYGLTCSLYDENSANNAGITCKDDSSFVSFSSVSGVGDGYQIADYDADSGRNDIVYKLSNGKWKYGGDAYRDTYSVRFSDMEKYILYTSYLKDIYGVTNKVCYEEGGHNGYEYEVKLWWEEKGKYSEHCYITTSQNQSKSVYGISSDGYLSHDLMSLQAMIAALNDLNLGDTPPTSIIDNNSENSSSSGEGGSVFDDCYNAGIESQSWIICPVVRNMTESIVGMDGMIDSWLSIDTNDFKANGGTQDAWGIFRNVANTAMIIMFLIIIFSQLTGYGIDNYGIKKMLPKLILMAILINLSFIICELAVDLSNIMGSGVQNLLRDIGEQINNGGDGKSIWDVVIKLLGAAAGTGAGAGVVISTVSSAAGAGPMIIVSILIMLLIALVAVLIFFLMLGARLVVVVFFTMISPLAFACYILPNTQGLFKKWWNIFKGALVVYPICGALYGLSYLIRGALSDSNDIPMLLVAAVSPYLPFLALPVLLKGTLSALGVVGNAITTLGSGLRKGLSAGSSTWNKTMQGTEAYKNRMDDVFRRRQEQNAQRFIDRMKRRRDRGLEVSENDLRREASAEKLLNKHRSDYEEARTTLAKRNAQNMTADDLKNEFVDAFNNNDGSEEAQARLIAATNAWHERSGPAIFNDLADHVGAIDIQGSESAQHSLMAMQRLMSTNSRFASDAMNKSGDLGEMFSNAGIKGRGPNGKLTFKNLSDYTKDHHTMTQDKDWATQSAATLQRAIKSGALSLSDAMRLLNSNDPTIVSGLQSDQNKRDTLQSFVNGFDWANYDLKSDTNAIGQKLFNQSADQYRSAIEESKRQAAEHAQSMEDRRVEALEENVRQMQALNESLRHGGSSTTTGQSSDQTNPTDGQIL